MTLAGDRNWIQLQMNKKYREIDAMRHKEKYYLKQLNRARKRLDLFYTQLQKLKSDFKKQTIKLAKYRKKYNAK